MPRKRREAPKGEPLITGDAAPSQGPVEGAKPAAKLSQEVVPQVVLNLHQINTDIFELLAMRDTMLEQGRDTSAVDKLIAQQTEAFSEGIKKIVDEKTQGVVKTPKLKGARRKTTVELLEEIRDKLDIAGPKVL